MPYPLQNQPADLRESMYFPEIIRGIGTITRHFLKNLFFSRDANPDVLNRKRGGFGYSDNVTLQYPEEKAPYAPAYRGLHRLVPREDGRPRCVACYMCATACPAQCIYIEAGEYADDPIEKYPVKFVIDELRCIVCGFCVEACPKDAIRMDSGEHAPAVLRARGAGLGREAAPARPARLLPVRSVAPPRLPVDPGGEARGDARPRQAVPRHRHRRGEPDPRLLGADPGGRGEGAGGAGAEALAGQPGFQHPAGARFARTNRAPAAPCRLRARSPRRSVSGRPELLSRIAKARAGSWATFAALALAAALVDLGAFHHLEQADSIVPVLVSLQRWTLFYWDQERYGMLVPLLALPVRDPLWNLLLQRGLLVLAGLAAVVLLARHVLARRDWRVAGALAAAALLAAPPEAWRFEYLGDQPYGLSLALALSGARLRRADRGRAPRRAARGGAPPLRGGALGERRGGAAAPAARPRARGGGPAGGRAGRRGARVGSGWRASSSRPGSRRARPCCTSRRA